MRLIEDCSAGPILLPHDGGQLVTSTAPKVVRPGDQSPLYQSVGQGYAAHRIRTPAAADSAGLCNGLCVVLTAHVPCRHPPATASGRRRRLVAHLCLQRGRPPSTKDSPRASTPARHNEIGRTVVRGARPVGRLAGLHPRAVTVRHLRLPHPRGPCCPSQTAAPPLSATGRPSRHEAPGATASAPTRTDTA